MNISLYAHQISLIDDAPRVHGIFFDCGLGKTATAIRMAEQHSDGILVVCPKSVKINWEIEINQWAVGKSKWKIVTKEEFRACWKHKWVGFPKAGGIIIDEGHWFLGINSQLHKAMVSYLSHKRDCVYILTATPYMSTPMNIYALEKLLYRSPNYLEYRSKFFYDVFIGGRKVPIVKKKIESAIAGIVRSLGSVVHRKDVFDVPDIVYKKEYFTLTKQQEKAIVALDEDPLTLPHIAYWTARHQICGGTRKGALSTYKSDKLKRLKEYASEYKKFVVFARYNAELEMIKETLGKRVVIVNGKAKNREDIFNKANDSDDTILAINAMISEGYNLPTYELIIFYSNDFSLKNRIQAEGRIQRGEYVEPRCVIDFLIKGDIDEDVYRCLSKKKDFQLELYDNKRFNEVI